VAAWVFLTVALFAAQQSRRLALVQSCQSANVASIVSRRVARIFWDLGPDTMARATAHGPRQASRGSAAVEAQGSWADALPMVELLPHAAMAERRGEASCQS
jgi:hypothetical protein